ncbi:3-hydroxybutyryl-CoA dehydrogenase [Hwanghaeella sp.]|uniref:3-hydroxybutyryl-CoA dehydrogenase n=1 Tax=Hwanghaeella sp. TaxID=2605943 RepID=UPI003CCC1B14
MTDQQRAPIAAVGAGRMGRGVAIVFAYAGHPVRLIDVKNRPAEDFDRLAREAEVEIHGTLRMLVDLGLAPEGSVETIAARISVAGREEAAAALSDAAVIFEGVPETLEAKREAFDIVSAAAPADAIVASTTSTILADELQAMVSPPERFLNAHWLNPAYLVPLVELSPGAATDPAVVDRLKALLEGIGKVPVVCKASPGYIVPRIQALAMNEAARLVEEGVATPEDIDKATKYGFGFRFAVLGLLEFIDWGGGDILFYASRYMRDAMQDERFAAPKIVEDNMAAGRVGLSAKAGFLDYSDMDIDAYRKGRLAGFVDMLTMLGATKPPVL